MPESVREMPHTLATLSVKRIPLRPGVAGSRPGSFPQHPREFDPEDRCRKSRSQRHPGHNHYRSRNMWMSAMERIRFMLKEAGARRVGNIALVDKHHNFISFVTIFYWMFKGKKDRWLNRFPKPGVSG